LEEAQGKVDEVLKQFRRGLITEEERYNRVISVWSDVKDVIQDKLMASLDDTNPIYMMSDSGARGNASNFTQLAGMRGLMANPAGRIIELPIKSSFREGLTVLEYFISTHGARKGLADTALKTADAGYLTRRLVDVSQDVIIKEKDCGTLRGIKMKALKDHEDVIESLDRRILGRVSLHDIHDPLTDELLCEANQLIDEEVAQSIAETSIEEVEIRSVLTCECEQGVCTKCYGRDLSRGTMVQVGEAVGVIAAQSIGEPGTQLTLRTFHVGGTASRVEAQSQHKAKFEGKVKFENIRVVEYDDGEELHDIVLSRAGEIKIINEDGKELTGYNIPYGSELLVEEGDVVPKGVPLCSWDPYNANIYAEIDGTVEYKDILDDITVAEETDSQTGHREKVVID